MPNAIKYKAGNLTGSLQKGNVALAVNDIVGPTSTTGWYNGPNFTQGTYQIIETAATGDPDVFCPQNDAELIKFVRWKGATGSNTGSVGAALAWIATQPNLLAVNEVYPNIVTDGDILNLDAQFVGSYPTTGSTWYDVSGNNINGTLTNGPTFNSNGAIVFDGVDDYVNCDNNSNPLLNPGPSEAWSLSTTFKNSQPLPNDNAIYGIAGKRVINEVNGYTLMLRGGNYNGVLARLSTSGQSLVDIVPITNYSNILSNGNYHQMVMTYGTNDTGSLYIDGVLVGQSIAPNFDFNNASSAFKIGVGDTNNNHPFNGNINSVSFYNKALTQAEISQNYYQAPIVTNGLVFAVDAGNLVSYESSSLKAYSLSLSGSSTTAVSCSLVNGLAFNLNNGGNFNFDGTDDQLLIEQTSAQSTGIRLGPGTTPWMVNAWIKTTTGGSNSIGSAPILTNRSGGPVYCNMGIGAGGVMKYNRYNLGWLAETGSIAVNNNQWHMLSWVNLNNNTLNMYVDGIFDKNVPSTIENAFNPVDIIGASWAGESFNGSIAFLSISISSSLYTTQNVQQTFNAQKGRFGL